MTPEQQAFIDYALPFAQVAANALEIPVAPILAQWADETRWGTSRAWTEGHNPAGISTLTDDQRAHGATDFDGGPVLAYPDTGSGVAGYVARWNEPVYAQTRELWSRQRDAASVAQAMQQSPWAAGHYNNGDLVRIIDQNNLTQYDGAPAGGGGSQPAGGGPGGPSPQAPCAGLPAGPAPEGHRTLKVGDSGLDVAEVQTWLWDRGIVCVNSFKGNGEPDGIFGPGTATGVVEFQNREGLHPDGIVGRQTWCAFGVR